MHVVSVKVGILTIGDCTVHTVEACGCAPTHYGPEFFDLWLRLEQRISLSLYSGVFGLCSLENRYNLPSAIAPINNGSFPQASPESSVCAVAFAAVSVSPFKLHQF